MDSGKRSLLWARSACVVITAAVMFLLFRKIDLKVLFQTFRTMRAGWYLASFALYGLLFIPAAWRWHLALRLNETVVRFAATARLSLIGHFFYTILFGAAGGDTAKCALYARWYKLPLPEILVAASLDRLMGFGGLILFSAAAFGVAALHGGFARIGSISIHWPGRWIMLGLLLIAAGLLLLRQTRRESAWTRFTNGFLVSGKRLLSLPGTVVPGVLCGLLVQMALSSVLAMNLQAVSHAPVPWLKLAWTFPAISVISALPISIAGLGVRDSAALMLLGLFGVSKTDAVAASLLTASIGVGWAIIDGLLLWHESARQREWPVSKTISAIVHANGDASLAEMVQKARAVPGITEVLVTDESNTNRTREIAAAVGCRVIAGSPDQLKQMQSAATAASGDVLLFLHSQTRLPVNIGQIILRTLRDSSVAGGSLRKRCAWPFSFEAPTSASDTLFMRREVPQSIPGAANVPSNDDLEFFRRLQKAGRWIIIADRTRRRC